MNDGQAWTTYATFQRALQLTEVGLFVGNHGVPESVTPAHTGSVDYFANISAPPVPNSIPIALDEAVREGKIKQNDIVLTAAFGAGLTWAGSVARW